MRWLVAAPGPDWSVADVHTGWVEALRALGEDVHEFNLADRLAFYDNAYLEVRGADPEDETAPRRLRKALTGEQAVELAVNGLSAALWKLRPDALLVVSGFFIGGELLDHARRRGTRVVIAHTEQPYELDRELELASHASLNLVNDPTHIDRFRDVAPTVYCPAAWREEFHQPGEPDPRLVCDLGFVGTGFGSRRWFFEQMRQAGAFDGLDVLLAGNWRGLAEDSPLRPFVAAEDPGHCLDNADAVRVYRSARVGLNLYRREAEHGQHVPGWSMGPREVEMAACGLFFLRDPRPEGDRVLAMLPRFGSPAEAGELLRWWLRHPDERRAAADEARAAVADRTFTEHGRSLLRLLDQ